MIRVIHDLQARFPETTVVRLQGYRWEVDRAESTEAERLAERLLVFPFGSRASWREARDFGYRFIAMVEGRQHLVGDVDLFVEETSYGYIARRVGEHDPCAVIEFVDDEPVERSPSWHLQRQARRARPVAVGSSVVDVVTSAAVTIGVDAAKGSELFEQVRKLEPYFTPGSALPRFDPFYINTARSGRTSGGKK